jgi:hypothetical protein
MRVGKILRFGRTRPRWPRHQLTNNDEITTYSQTFNPATATHLNAQGITPRVCAVQAQFDFNWLRPASALAFQKPGAKAKSQQPKGRIPQWIRPFSFRYNFLD